MEYAELKYRDDGAAIVAGYGVVYGGRDLDGDQFTAETKYGAMADLPVFYDHAQQAVKALDNEIGRVVSVKADDKGIWFETELDKAHEYYDEIVALVGRGVVGLSTGATSHLVRRNEAKTITRWPIAELSLTVTPAEPRTLGVTQIKATSGNLETAEGAAEAATQSAPDTSSVPVADIRIEVAETKEAKMAEETKAAVQEQPDMKALVEAAVSQQVADALKAIDSLPTRHAGYVTQDGGSADSHIKSVGDFLLAIKRSDTKRLNSVYKALSEDSGVTGGVLIPQEFSTRFLQAAYQVEGWLARVPVIPVTSPSGRYPSLEMAFTPTAGVGQTAAAGKMTGAKRAESGAYTETTPNFTDLQYHINDAVSGYVKVSRELNTDSPVSIEALLVRLIGIVNASKLAHYVLNGNGVGEPLGILNSAALYQQIHASATALAKGDVTAMISRFQTFGDGLFVAHRSNLPDIHAIIMDSGIAYTNNANTEPGSLPLFGYPVYTTEHLPVTDNANSVLLIDPSAYCLWELGNGYIDYSEHADFTNGNVLWRFGRRIDGQPALKGTIKQGNPGTAFEVTPFVAAKFATS